MQHKLYLILIVASVLTLSFQEISLQQVTEVYRHGSRQPVWIKFWYPSEFTQPGELLPLGMRQQYNLGQILRERYINELEFLPQNYSMYDLYVRSTNFNRTLMSAQSQLLGLYPLGTGPNLPAGFNQSIAVPPYKNLTVDYSSLGNAALPYNFQTIPIHSVNASKDYLLTSYMTQTCPNLEPIQENNFQTPIFQQITDEMQPTLQYLANQLNITRNLTVFDGYSIMDNFQTAIFTENPLPFEIDENSQMWKNLTFMQEISWYLAIMQTQEQINIANTNFFMDLISNFNASINQEISNVFKWRMYSAHDTTIIQLLAGLNYSSYQCIYQKFKTGTYDSMNCENNYPGYASSMIFELYFDPQNSSITPYVKIMYEGNYLQMCEVQDKYECDFDVFVSQLQNRILPMNVFNSSCGVTNTPGINFYQYISYLSTESINNRLTQEKSLQNIGLLAFGIFQIVLMIALLAFVFRRFHKKNQIQIQYQEQQQQSEIQQNLRQDLIEEVSIHQ